MTPVARAGSALTPCVTIKASYKAPNSHWPLGLGQHFCMVLPPLGWLASVPSSAPLRPSLSWGFHAHSGVLSGNHESKAQQLSGPGSRRPQGSPHLVVGAAGAPESEG